MSELIKCDWCGEMVPAQPEIFTEGGYDAVPDQEEMSGEDWKGYVQAPENLQSLTEEQKARLKVEMGLEDEELEKLLQTGSVSGIGVVVCLKCQDAASVIEDQPPS